MRKKILRLTDIPAHIPVMRPALPTADKLTRFLQKIDENRLYSNFAPLCNRLSELLAIQFNVEPENVLLVTNGTLALQAAVATATKSNSTWTIPAWTFVASAQAVISAGSKFVLEDVAEESWTLEPGTWRASDGVMVVAPFGDEPDLISWAAESNHRPILIDAASCFDACRNLRLVNKYNIAVMVSLHATKLVSTGEGGVIVGPKPWIADMRRWTNFGFYGDRVARDIGTNAKMSEYQAAVGLASLDMWSDTRVLWQEASRNVKTALEEANVKCQPAIGKGFVTSTMVANFSSPEQKIRVVSAFESARIETRDWWGGGVHQMPAFKDISKSGLGVTDSLAARTTGVPLFIDMTSEHIDRISQAVSCL